MSNFVDKGRSLPSPLPSFFPSLSQPTFHRHYFSPYLLFSYLSATSESLPVLRTHLVRCSFKNHLLQGSVREMESLCWNIMEKYWISVPLFIFPIFSNTQVLRHTFIKRDHIPGQCAGSAGRGTYHTTLRMSSSSRTHSEGKNWSITYICAMACR